MSDTIDDRDTTEVSRFSGLDIAIINSRISGIPVIEIDVSDIVYHYTTADGLNSILQKDGIHLWFTRYDCVNDMREGQDILNIFHDTGERLLRENKIDHDFWQKIQDICLKHEKLIPAAIYDKYDISMGKGFYSKVTPYVCCFSYDNDSLPMWNYYAKDGSCQGYNIKVCPYYFYYNPNRSVSFEDILLSSNGLLQYANRRLKLQCHSVIYDEDEKSQIIEKAIMMLYPHRDEDNKKSYLGTIWETIEFMLLEWKLFFKKPCFEYEQEQRMILWLSDDYPSNTVDNGELEVKYRTKNGFLIPYVEMTFPNKEAVKGITIGQLGSKENQDFAKSTLQSFLKTRGYQASIDCSNIEFRF